MRTSMRAGVGLSLGFLLVLSGPRAAPGNEEAPGRQIPEFAFEPAAPGNVFVSPERPRVPVLTRGDRVEWTLADYWHRPVASGGEAVREHRATVVLPADRAGYFLLHLVVTKDGKTLADRYTSLAVIPPHDVKDRDRSPFGVMTHFAQDMDTGILPLLATAGIASIRDEHYWSQVEQIRGNYAFSERSDRYMAACKAAGVDPLIAMTFGNALYDDAEGPSTPDGYDGYGRYGQAILRHYGGQIRWLEVWNEYNGSWCPPRARADRPKHYTEMLRAAYRDIKALRPDVQVLGCACVLIPLPYIEGIFKHGGLECMDGVVIHPYRARPEGVDVEVDELNALIRKYNNGRDKPVWVTETGCHDRREFEWEAGRGMYELGRRNGARYLTRMYTLLLSRHVARIYWYLGMDHMDFASMGLLRRPDDPMGRYAVAPAYVAYATLIRQLDGARFVEREACREYTRTRVYRFRRGTEDVRVCWATQPARIRVRTGGPLQRVSLVGESAALPPVRGEVVLDLDEDAVFLVGSADSVEEIDTGVRVLADVADDYTRTQGRNGWRYGYYDGTGAGRGDGAEPGGPYTDDDFKEMTEKETMWGVHWAGPAEYLSLSGDSMHPEKIDGRDAWAVVRWQSPVAGDVRLVGGFTRAAAGGDGVEARIQIDGRSVFERHIGGVSASAADFDLTVPLHRGSLVDLGVGPGGDIGFDATEYRLRVLQSTPPPPRAPQTTPGVPTMTPAPGSPASGRSAPRPPAPVAVPRGR